MEEIVVALRETRRAAGRGPPFTVVGGQRDDKRASDPTMDARSVTDIAQLRDSEIERLLSENARLNERIMYLLKVIENMPTPHGNETPGETDGEAILKDIRTALETELRPVLGVLLRLLEKLRGPVGRQPHNDGGIIDLDAARAHE